MLKTLQNVTARFKALGLGTRGTAMGHSLSLSRAVTLRIILKCHETHGRARILVAEITN